MTTLDVPKPLPAEFFFLMTHFVFILAPSLFQGFSAFVFPWVPVSILVALPLSFAVDTYVCDKKQYTQVGAVVTLLSLPLRNSPSEMWWVVNNFFDTCIIHIRSLILFGLFPIGFSTKSKSRFVAVALAPDNSLQRHKRRFFGCVKIDLSLHFSVICHLRWVQNFTIPLHEISWH